MKMLVFSSPGMCLLQDTIVLTIRHIRDHDVQQHMDIKHYEMLMTMFEEHKNDDGTGGFDIEKVRRSRLRFDIDYSR